MTEFVELTNEHQRHCAEYWDGNELMNVLGYGEHHYVSKEPLRIHVRRQQFGDMLWVSYPQLLFISNRLHEMLQNSNISGYETLAANVRLAFEHDPAESLFWQVGVTGWGGIAKPECGLVCVNDSVFPRLYTKALGSGPVFDPEKWDGSDFFRIWPTPGIYVSRRVVTLLEREKIKYYRTLPIDMYRNSTNEHVFTGRPLQCWFQDDRARQIGIPFGLYWEARET